MNDEDLDIALELARIQHRAMQRSKLLMDPCSHCGVWPIFLQKDSYGYPSAVSFDHLKDCVFE